MNANFSDLLQCFNDVKAEYPLDAESLACAAAQRESKTDERNPSV